MRARAKRPNSRRGGGARPWTLGRKLQVWGSALGALLLGYAAYAYATLPHVEHLRTENPPTTALIEQRAQEARDAGRKPRRKQHWVGLSQISKHAVDAVLLSEDAAFFQHDGVDRHEMKKALADAWEKGELGRGASTLTMQLAKNLWLSTDRSLLRKAKELLLTQRLEEALPKKRILTLYLNVAEWGEGVYGIEAAAREHFGVQAWELRPAQAITLATMLPAPRQWLPSRRSKRHHQKARRILDRMEATGRLSADDARDAREELERMFEGGGVANEDG